MQLKSRQIGISHVNGANGVLWGMCGETTTIVSVGEREAFEVLDKSQRHARVLEGLGSELARQGPKTSELNLASGGRFLALPSTSGGRSFSGNVILDEFGYLKDPAGVWDAAAGSALLGYRMRINSTPNGVGNAWHGLWTDPEQHRGYTRHQTTLDDAIAQGYPVNLEDCWKLAKGDPRLFDQMFRCKFLDGASQYIPSEYLTAASRDYALAPPPSEDDGETFGGIDIGLTRDLLVLVIVRKVGEIRWITHIESHKGNVDDQVLDALIAKAFSPQGYGCSRVCADATGMGSVPALRWSRIYGERFEPIVFSQKSKEAMATGLHAVTSSAQLVMPRSYVYNGVDEAPLLRDDICAIRRTVTSTGAVRYEAPRNSAGHADRAWGAMLALQACEADLGPSDPPAMFESHNRFGESRGGL
jgi:phage FluMu gp28-like protein